MPRGKKKPYLSIPYGLLLENGLSDCDKMVLALILSFYDNEKDFFYSSEEHRRKDRKIFQSGKV